MRLVSGEPDSFWGSTVFKKQRVSHGLNILGENLGIGL